MTDTFGKYQKTDFNASDFVYLYMSKIKRRGYTDNYYSKKARHNNANFEKYKKETYNDKKL